MAFNYSNSGLTNTAEYMASGLPYVVIGTANTGSVDKIEFPFVTNFFEVKNTGASGSISVGFTENGVQLENYFTVGSGETRQFKLRIKELYVTAQDTSSSYDVVAGLTQILRKQFPTLSGSHPEYDSTLTGSYVYGYEPGLG